MKEILDFLHRLQRNNDRDWFNGHKDEYKALQAEFHVFVERLVDGISGFDDSVRGLTAKDCTYRIYRDTRFSNDKTPYKTHFSAFVAPGGKNSGNAGYYFHVEPKGGAMLGGNFMSAGIYMPAPAALRSIREDISLNGEEFLALVKKAEGFSIGKDDSLKRIPLGFPADSPYADYLKLKNFSLDRMLDDDYVLAPDLLPKTVEAFRLTSGFVRWINRAVTYAREEA